MAALPLYSFASLPLLCLGLWHLVASSLSFLKSPRDFSAKPWYPFPARLRHLQLSCELLLLLLALSLHSLSLSRLPPSSTPQIFALQQLLMLLLFFVVRLLTLLSETTSALPLPSEGFFLLLGLAFSVEWMVLDRVADPQLLLERECFGLLGSLAALCAGSCLLLAWRPKAFFVNLVFCASLSLQGTWLLQIGLSLFSERFLPEGCHRLNSGSSTQCDVDAAKLRATALIDLAFIIHILVMMCVFAGMYGLISGVMGYKRNGGYEAIEVNGELDHLQIRPSSTKVVVD